MRAGGQVLTGSSIMRRSSSLSYSKKDLAMRSERSAMLSTVIAGCTSRTLSMIDESESVRHLMQRLSEEYLAAIERLDSLQPQ